MSAARRLLYFRSVRPELIEGPKGEGFIKEWFDRLTMNGPISWAIAVISSNARNLAFPSHELL